MNKVMFVGNISKDLELKYIPNSSTATVTFPLAVKRIRSKDGEPDVDFFNIVVYGNQAENLCNYQGKGSKIGVIGKLRNRSYENKDKKKVYVTELVAEEIHFLSSKKDDLEPVEVNDDDMPF